jgi:hypothetical protein
MDWAAARIGGMNSAMSASNAAYCQDATDDQQNMMQLRTFD